MSINIGTQNYITGNTSYSIDKHPNECPYCHKIIAPRYYTGTYNDTNKILELIYYCTNDNCQRLFLAFYKKEFVNDLVLKYTGIIFGHAKVEAFPDVINNISPQFIKIYNEALFAEQHNLNEICGAGYRKSLEFLIKDYLISKDSLRAEEIKKKFLGNCIKDDVNNSNIKTVAARATWLGNDATHYIRVWEDKDLSNLKDLIRLTVNWIVDETLTEKYKNDMPEK